VDTYIAATDDRNLVRSIDAFERDQRDEHRDAVTRQLEREIRYLGSSDFAHLSRYVRGIDPAGASVGALRSFNAEFGTDYSNPESEPEQNHHVDVWAVDSQRRRRGFQVTKPDTAIWRPLARSQISSAEEPEADLHLRLVDAVVRAKEHHGDLATVLVLDGWGIVSPDSIRRIRAALRARLANLGFHSVWFCNRPPEASATRVDR
jgi:hypothetical protein